MRKVVISLHECVPGMQMAETIFNEYGAAIVAENTILDNHIIKKLNNLDIVKFKIYDQNEDIITSNDSEIFKAQYTENVQVVKDLLHDMSQGKNLDVQKVNTVSESVFERINENRDIVSCINQIRDVDEYTYSHSVNVSLLSMLIAKWLKMDSEKIKLIVQAGLLHDIGKSKVPPGILNKPSKLTKEEFEEIKKHSIYGYRILEKIPEISREVSMGVLMHHEREDGTGYPVGLRGNQITDIAKILTVADIYDAMTSKRVYKEKESPFDVFELLENNTYGVLDTVVIKTFLANIAAYYIGDLVVLNTNQIGEIIYINGNHISQPIIRIENKYIDLSINRSMKILELV